MFIFNIDRGGTFTDFYVQKVEGNKIVQEYCFKAPSQGSQGQGPIVGIKQFLTQHIGESAIKDGKIVTKFIKCLNAGTTIATNALLERKGSNSVVIVSEGFDDMLTIRNQTRPNIFDLKCVKPKPLTDNVLTVNSRIYLHDVSSMGPSLQCIKEGVFYQPASHNKLEALIQQIQKINPESVGVSLCNSYLSAEAQNYLEQYLLKKQNKITKIEKGSSYVELGYLKRTETVSLDCYLNPIMNKYFSELILQFDEPQEIEKNMRIMKSDGGFTIKSQVRASELLLSGPAGGLIGYSKISQELKKYFGLNLNSFIGLDMGGTSTDVSKVKNNSIELQYSFEAEGIEICTPHLVIETIAAGGGSKLGFSNGMLTVGPESVGSNPGPACYGIGDELAVTDANLLLHRLDVSFFPKVFGKDQNSLPDQNLSKLAFEQMAERIKSVNQNKKTIYELAEGYIEIANELMAKSARKILTLGKPDALVVFGSAGGQHCCDIAEKIGVSHVIVHRFSGILSAYGLSKANETKQTKIYLGLEANLSTFNFEQLKQAIEKLRGQSHIQNSKQADQIKEEVTIAYMGTSYSIKVLLTPNLLKQFEVRHKQENGFSLPNKCYKIQYYVCSYIKKPQSYQRYFELKQPRNAEEYCFGKAEVFLNGKFQSLPKYKLKGMENCTVRGPALIFSDTSSILVQQKWVAHIVAQNVHISKQTKQYQETIEQTVHDLSQDAFEYKDCDPIRLTIFSTRLMGIAEEMGKILQKTSISTNIKERLDFSCGIFDWNGHLLANAPHLPVHLGSMETAVVEQIKRGIKPGDVILSNHPAAGGSHLPDLTVITCFEIVKGINFYVASRGHHADIGGLTPGSMPPFSRELREQGVAIQKFELVKNEQFLEKETRELFKESRRQNDNISDLLAQISANEIGIKLLKILISEYGVLEFRKYVYFVCLNAKQSVQEMLYNFSKSQSFPECHTISNVQYMDDGTPLSLNLTIDRSKKQAVFDFTETGPEVIGNTNAPRSITRSAVLYCLRSLLNKQIPLNSGCLIPIKFVIPEHSILSPSKQCAVVGGNVETSQKLVDLILKPFGYVACSQGTMNNFLFGNSKLSYYQTICGGSGAGNGFNGTTVQCHMTNTRITDAEHLERYYPVVLRQFRKRKESGGKGKWKGGDGVTREMVFLDSMEVSLLTERRVYSPYGLQGGANGLTGANYLITSEGVKKNIGGKNCFQIKPFDSVVINTPGGGGFGLKQN